MKILLSTPCADGMVCKDYLMSVLTETFNAPDRLLQQHKYEIGINLIHGNSGLSKDRSVMASQAIHLGYDKLLFIDSDMSWTWGDLKKLFNSDKPIITGIAPLKKYPLSLNFTQLERDNDCFTEENGVVTPKGLNRLIQKYPGQEEIEIAMVGTAFSLWDVGMLKELTKVAEPFLFTSRTTNQMPCWEFFPSGAIEGIYFGEDWAACRMAKKMGYKVYMNHTVRINHHGDHVYQIGNELHATP